MPLVLRTIAIFLLVTSLLLSCSRPKDSTTTDIRQSTSEYYTADDFIRLEKFDSHIHLNTEQTDFIVQAAKDNLRFLVIVDDRPFGITMEDQQEIVRKQLEAFPGRSSPLLCGDTSPHPLSHLNFYFHHDPLSQAFAPFQRRGRGGDYEHRVLNLFDA